MIPSITNAAVVATRMTNRIDVKLVAVTLGNVAAGECVYLEVSTEQEIQVIAAGPKINQWPYGMMARTVGHVIDVTDSGAIGRRERRDPLEKQAWRPAPIPWYALPGLPSNDEEGRLAYRRPATFLIERQNDERLSTDAVASTIIAAVGMTKPTLDTVRRIATRVTLNTYPC